MPSMNIEQFGDAVRLSLSNFEEPNYVDISLSMTDLVAANRLIGKMKDNVKSGKNCTWRVNVRTGNSARNNSPTDPDQVNIVDTFEEATTNWRNSETKYAFLEHEVAINMTPKRLVDLVAAREANAAQDFLKLLEDNFWDFPSASDTRTPFGIPYWVTKNATEGFSGGIPTGYSSVAGISPTTYTRWNNRSGQYTSVSMSNLVRMARTMRWKSNFKPQVKRPDVAGKASMAYATNLTVYQDLADLVDTRNDNIGSDLAKNDIGFALGKIDVEYAPKLDEDTTNPLYQIDYGTFAVSVLGNRWAKKKVIAPYPGQRFFTGVFTDYTYQIICFDRSRNGVLATGTSYP